MVQMWKLKFPCKDGEKLMCMEILRKTREYTVKIRVNNDTSTGVIFAPESHEYLYVFTTLHSIEGFFNDEKPNPDVTFYFLDKYEKMRIHNCHKNDLEFISFIEDGEKDNVDYEACKGTARDIAVLRIPANAFNVENREKVVFPKLRIASQNVIENGTPFYGMGYPNDSPAPEDLTAVKNALLEERYHLKCTLDNINNFSDMMKGYSGGGLFIESRNKSPQLVCLTSGCKEGEQNNYFFAVSIYPILDRMKKEGWPDPRDEVEYIPDSLDGFIDAAADFFDNEFEINEHEAIKMGIEDLQKLGLKPICFLCEGKNDKFASIRCCANSSDCENYWKGQLIKAFCFCKVNGEPIENLNELTYSLENGEDSEKEKNIKIEFICSKQNPGDFVRSLFEQKFHMESSKIEDGSIFVWNGNGDNNKSAYDKIFDRKSINQICRTILTNNGKKLNAEGRKKLEGTDYNIVNGDIPYFNYAIIGTHRLAQNVIENSDGNEEEMKENLHQIMNKIWGKDDE